ncbi:MAG TPA: hypothetical protein VJ396_01940 [Acidiferrobacterales bacterium]|nr:hypothetical protein [Acidiferrobacterales bacterium]
MRFHNTVLVILILVFAGSTPAPAASLAEHFQAFVLGAQAQARPLEARDLRLDAIAQGCLQCHDGSRASHVSVRSAGTPMPIRGYQTLNHPMGMSYDRSVSKDPHGYRPRSALHPNVQLVDGQVTCISCHQLRSNAASPPILEARLEPGKDTSCSATRELTMGRHDKDLCLACHIK